MVRLAASAASRAAASSRVRLTGADCLARHRKLKPVQALRQRQGELSPGGNALRAGFAQGLGAGRRRVGRKHLGDGAADKLFRGRGQELASRRMVVVVTAVAIDLEHQVGNRVEGGLQLISRRQDFGFGALALGDVLGHAKHGARLALGIEFDFRLLPYPADFAVDAHAVLVVEYPDRESRAPRRLGRVAVVVVGARQVGADASRRTLRQAENAAGFGRKAHAIAGDVEHPAPDPAHGLGAHQLRPTLVELPAQAGHRGDASLLRAYRAGNHGKRDRDHQ